VGRDDPDDTDGDGLFDVQEADRDPDDPDTDDDGLGGRRVEPAERGLRRRREDRHRRDRARARTRSLRTPTGTARSTFPVDPGGQTPIGAGGWWRRGRHRAPNDPLDRGILP
jgi:hypothetical protein